MRIYLDDVRVAPPGWVQARWPEEVISLIKEGGVKEISLDHDLADPFVVGQGYCTSCRERTGYDVLEWIEEQVATTDFVPPVIHIHTANCSAEKKMRAALASINRLIRERDE